MKILLTGASGFVGHRLLEELRPHHTVTTLTHRLPWDQQLTDQSYDVLIHNGAPVPKTTSEDTQETMQGYIQKTSELYHAVAKKIHHLMFVSTAEVYGTTAEPIPITEETRPNPPSQYAIGKVTAEAISLDFGATVVRLSVLYGPGDTINRAIPNFIHAALRNQPMIVNSPLSLRDYLHVDDAVLGIILAMKSSHQGIINLASGKQISIVETATIIKERCHSSSMIKQAATPPQHLLLDITKAKKLLNFSPKYLFPAKLEEEITWIKQQISLST